LYLNIFWFQYLRFLGITKNLKVKGYNTKIKDINLIVFEYGIKLDILWNMPLYDEIKLLPLQDIEIEGDKALRLTLDSRMILKAAKLRELEFSDPSPRTP
jgi:hypothetical protein